MVVCDECSSYTAVTVVHFLLDGRWPSEAEASNSSASD